MCTLVCCVSTALPQAHTSLQYTHIQTLTLVHIHEHTQKCVVPTRIRYQGLGLLKLNCVTVDAHMQMHACIYYTVTQRQVHAHTHTHTKAYTLAGAGLRQAQLCDCRCTHANAYMNRSCTYTLKHT